MHRLSTFMSTLHRSVSPLLWYSSHVPPSPEGETSTSPAFRQQVPSLAPPLEGPPLGEVARGSGRETEGVTTPYPSISSRITKGGRGDASSSLSAASCIVPGRQTPPLVRSHTSEATVRSTGGRAFFAAIMLAATVLLTGCDDLLGTKSDATTDEIFDAGRNEPGLFREVEYVPLFPFFTQAAGGGTFEAPQDVYVGYDEFIYVVDGRGLHALDLAGRPAAFAPIPGGGTSVIQDRRFDLYVTARRDTTLGGRTWNLPVVLHYRGLSTGSPSLVDVIWHPFDDDSRRFNRPDPIATDEEVAFTGVAVLPDNSIYVARRGPVNDLSSVILPHNIILGFSPEGINTQALVALSPTLPSLRSTVYPSDVLTFVQPPQRQFFPDEAHFVVAQAPPDEAQLRFPVLSIRTVVTPDGTEYRPDVEKIQAAGDPTRGDGFLYEEFKFAQPSDLAYAADATNYLFVLDAAKDSLFVFNARGIEGVAPPPGGTSTLPVDVSFGGTGDGALQFRDPQGVAYFDRIVYVADTGNGRISRFRLNTDFE